MDVTKVKGLVLTGVVLMAWALAAWAQTSTADSTKSEKRAQKRAVAAQGKYPYAPNSQLYDNGSYANWRHEMTGSNNPGHLFGPTGTTGLTGYIGR